VRAARMLRLAFNTIFGVSDPCASPPPGPSIFSDYSFWFHHPVNWDDQHLLANAMALFNSIKCVRCYSNL
jgi:hypothetical protein